jgi:hypothetical protein
MNIIYRSFKFDLKDARPSRRQNNCAGMMESTAHASLMGINSRKI